MNLTHRIFMAAAWLLAVPTAMAADLNVAEGIVTRTDLAGTAATVSGTAELHLTSRNPLQDGTVALSGEAMLCLEGIVPSEADDFVAGKVTVNGEAFSREKHRLAIYGSGCAIMADGFRDPLTIFDEANFGGNSMVCEQDVYYRTARKGQTNWLTEDVLGAFDNKIRSFKLRKGYQATLANNPDGTGHSQVFMAWNGDLEVPAMPDGLEFVSFIRVCKLDWVGKKGTCSGDHTMMARATWFYDWGSHTDNTDNAEYVPMRHNRWWDGFDGIGSRVNTSNSLGYNEPDHTDQSNIQSTDDAVRMWPDFFKTGLRIGSPAPDNIGSWWLKKFIATCDSLNYRVDFVATHMYWDSQTPANLTRNIINQCNNNYGGRTMWITEWNNGANWTHEAWPDKQGTKLDAHFNPVLDENGHTTTVNRPHTQANSEKQCTWLAAMLKAFDECPMLERHSLYSWVEDARQITLKNTEGVEELTPSGEVFANFQSVPGYDPEVAYQHTWRPAPALLEASPYTSLKYIEIKWYDHNGETAKHYVIEYKCDNEPWTEAGTYTVSKTRYGTDVKYKFFPERNGRYLFRLKAVSYKDTESIWSRIAGADFDGFDAIDTVNAAGVTISSNAGVLTIHGLADGVYPLYGVDGRIVRNITVEGDTTVADLPHGLYIFNRTKVAI